MSIQQVRIDFITRYQNAGIKGLQGELRDLGRHTAQAGTKVGAGLEQIARVSHAAGTALLVGVGGALAVGIAAAIQFEDAFAGVRKTVEASEPEFEALAGALREMSKSIPISLTELTKIAELGGQLGIPIEGLEQFVEVIGILGATTDLGVEEAATALARLANIMGTEISDFDNLAATVVDLGNNFATTESEILNFALRLAGIGSTLGATEQDILGIATAFTSLGEPAERGATAIQRTLIELEQIADSGGPKLQELANIMGVTADEAERMVKDNPAAAFLAFETGLGRIIDEGGDAIGTIKDIGINTQRTFTSLLKGAVGSDVLSDALLRSNTAWEDSNAHLIEADKRFQTTRSQITLLSNQAKDFAITLGTDAMPAIRNVVQVLQGFFGVLSENQGVVNAFITAVVALGIGRGLKALLGFGGVLKNVAFTELPAFFSTMSKGRHTQFGPWKTGIKDLWTNLGGFSGVLTVATIGLGAIATVMAHSKAKAKQLEAAVKTLSEAWEDFGQDSEEAIEAFIVAWEQATTNIFDGGGTKQELIDFAESLGISLNELQTHLEMSAGDFENWKNDFLDPLRNALSEDVVGGGMGLIPTFIDSSSVASDLIVMEEAFGRIGALRDQLEADREVGSLISESVAAEIQAEVDRIMADLSGREQMLALMTAMLGDPEKVTDFMDDWLDSVTGFADEFNDVWRSFQDDFGSGIVEWESKWQEYEQVAAFSMEELTASLALLAEDNTRLINANNLVLETMGPAYGAFWRSLTEETQRGLAAVLAEGGEFDFLNMLDLMFSFDEGSAADLMAAQLGHIPQIAAEQMNKGWPGFVEQTLADLDARFGEGTRADPDLMVQHMRDTWTTWLGSLDPAVAGAIPGWVRSVGDELAKNADPLDIREYMNLTSAEKVEWWKSQGATLAQALALGFNGYNFLGNMTPAINKASKDIVRIVKGNLRIESPSKVFEDIGKQTALGFNQGFAMNLGGKSFGAQAFTSAVAPEVTVEGGGGSSLTINYPQHKENDILDAVQKASAMAGLQQLAETTPGRG